MKPSRWYILSGRIAVANLQAAVKQRDLALNALYWVLCSSGIPLSLMVRFVKRGECQSGQRENVVDVEFSMRG